MKKSKMKRRLASAVAMLLVSTMMLGTATYAWFTMNKTVTVTGMEVRTKVGSNLLVSHDTSIAGTTKNADNTFTTTDTTAVKAWLEPVSTNNAAATNFWYTLNAAANGAKISGDYLDYDVAGLGNATNTTNFANKFSEDYGVLKSEVTSFGATTTPQGAAVGYVDYVFQLKATNTEDAAANINLTQLDLTYNKDDTANVARNGELAFRAAIFVEAENTGKTAYENAGGTTLNSIYKPSAAAYFTANAGVSGANATTAVSNLVTTATPLASVAAGDTNYYKVVVRLWIEGEDTTCTSETFANLTDTWSLDLELQLGQGTPVTELQMLPATP